MQIHYNAKTDLLYLRLDDRKQNTLNRRVAEDVVLDIGDGDRIVGIEILDAKEVLGQGSLPTVILENVPLVKA